MTDEQYNKVKEFKDDLKIVEDYIAKFNPDNYCVWLHTTDQYGNKGPTLDLYAIKNLKSLGYSIDTMFVQYYKEFLIKCTKALEERREFLENEIRKI